MLCFFILQYAKLVHVYNNCRLSGSSSNGAREGEASLAFVFKHMTVQLVDLDSKVKQRLLCIPSV